MREAEAEGRETGLDTVLILVMVRVYSVAFLFVSDHLPLDWERPRKERSSFPQTSPHKARTVFSVCG